MLIFSLLKDRFWIKDLVNPDLVAAQLLHFTAGELLFSCFFAVSVALCTPHEIIFPSFHLLVSILSTSHGAQCGPQDMGHHWRDLLCSFWKWMTFSQISLFPLLPLLPLAVTVDLIDLLGHHLLFFSCWVCLWMADLAVGNPFIYILLWHTVKPHDFDRGILLFTPLSCKWC